jgi:hypothetical protein
MMIIWGKSKVLEQEPCPVHLLPTNLMLTRPGSKSGLRREEEAVSG